MFTAKSRFVITKLLVEPFKEREKKHILTIIFKLDFKLDHENHNIRIIKNHINL